jgi:hypothetical protein
MHRRMRTVMVAMAVAAGGFAAPAAANAAFPTWSPDGATEGTGWVKLTFSPTGASVTCNYTTTANLVNNGTSNGGTVTNVFPGPCLTNVPNCFVGYAIVSMPWQITKVTSDPTRVGLTMGVNLSFGGATCALNGVSVPITGSVEGDYDGTAGEWSFVAESGLSSPLGPFVMDGELELRNEATTALVDLT